MRDDDYILLVKFLFNPTLTTIWDLNNLLQRDGEVPSMLKKLLEPIIDTDDEQKERFVTKESIDKFLENTRNLFEILVKRELREEAFLFFVRQFSVFNYLVMSYLVWHHQLNNELNEIFGKGRFEEGAFEKLLRSLIDGFWFELSEKIKARPFLYFALLSQLISIELFVKTSKKVDKDRIKNVLNKLDVNNVFSVLEDSISVDYIGNDLFLLNLLQPMLANLIVFTSLIDSPFLLELNIVKRTAKRATELLKYIFEAKKKMSGDLFLEDIMSEIIDLFLKLDAGEKTSLDTLKELGFKILEIRMNKFYDSRLIPLLLPGDAQSIPIVLMKTFEVNLVDVFNPSNLLRIQQEIIQGVLSLSHPVEALFKRILFKKIDQLKEFVQSLIKDPLAYIPFILLLGWVEVQLIEAIIMILTDHQLSDSRKSEVEKIFSVLNHIVKEVLQEAERLLNEYEKKYDWVKELVGFYTSRMTIHLTSRLGSPNIRDKILEISKGREFMELLDRLSRLNENIFGKPSKEPEVSDLFT